eukprot:6208294-Pleurochrysis_carterae.AAC.4
MKDSGLASSSFETVAGILASYGHTVPPAVYTLKLGREFQRAGDRGALNAQNAYAHGMTGVHHAHHQHHHHEWFAPMLLILFGITIAELGTIAARRFFLCERDHRRVTTRDIVSW